MAYFKYNKKLCSKGNCFLVPQIPKITKNFTIAAVDVVTQRFI